MPGKLEVRGEGLKQVPPLVAIAVPTLRQRKNLGFCRSPGLSLGHFCHRSAADVAIAPSKLFQPIAAPTFAYATG